MNEDLTKNQNKQKSADIMSIEERILHEMKAIKAKKNNAIPGQESRTRDELILVEMEAIKTKAKNAPQGEVSRKRNLFHQLFAHLAAFLSSKRRDCHHDQIHESQDNVRAKQRQSRRKSNIEKKPACRPEVYAPSKSTLFQGFALSSNQETTEQEMTQSTMRSRRPDYRSFDKDELELDSQSNSSLSSVYSYRDSPPTSNHLDDFSIYQNMSMSTIGGTSMISDWESFKWRRDVTAKLGAKKYEF